MRNNADLGSFVADRREDMRFVSRSNSLCLKQLLHMGYYMKSLNAGASCGDVLTIVSTRTSNGRSEKSR